MELQTYSALKTKLQNDYDITDENFVSETELLGYMNEAIDDSETAIHNMGHQEKYFRVPGTLTLVSGTQDYAFPSDIYANKLMAIYYNDGSKKYPIEKLRDLNEIPFISSNDDYRYLIVNVSGTGPRIRLYPTPAENGAYVYLWYIRNMVRLTTSSASTNVCEIPECANFLLAHVKWNLAKKLRSPGLIAEEKDNRNTQYNLMLEALNPMTVSDRDNLIPVDYSAYNNQALEMEGT